MRPGATIIRKCSACAKAIKQRTVASGNTFGATRWTDGKRIIPMFPEQMQLALCPYCGAPQWIEDLERVGTIPRGGEAEERFADAHAHQTPSADDYFALLAKGVTDPKKERYVRLHAWWAGNDGRRKDDRAMPLSDREASNLVALTHMLDETDEGDLLLKAEALRELRRFDEALSLLAKAVTEDDKVARTARILTCLSLERDPCVRQVV